MQWCALEFNPSFCLKNAPVYTHGTLPLSFLLNLDLGVGFPFGTIADATISTARQVSLWVSGMFSFAYTPLSGTVQLRGRQRHVSLFEKLHCCFPLQLCNFASLPAMQEGRVVVVFSPSHHLFSFRTIRIIPVGVRVYIIVIFICIYLIINDVDYPLCICWVLDYLLWKSISSVNSILLFFFF